MKKRPEVRQRVKYAFTAKAVTENTRIRECPVCNRFAIYEDEERCTFCGFEGRQSGEKQC